jgi:REP element-mobilizing transposase RayT
MTRREKPILPEPLGYFLTWTTYGTWLPGDERGWVKRGRGHQLPDSPLRLEALARMAEDACRLDEDERRLVEVTIADHCRIRGWTLRAVNCRSNHLHVVVTAGVQPSEVRRQLKAWTARKLKQIRSESDTTSPELPTAVRDQWWTERGSKRYLNDEASLEAAILYVRDAQDAPARHR